MLYSIQKSRYIQLSMRTLRFLWQISLCNFAHKYMVTEPMIKSWVPKLCFNLKSPEHSFYNFKISRGNMYNKENKKNCAQFCMWIKSIQLITDRPRCWWMKHTNILIWFLLSPDANYGGFFFLFWFRIQRRYIKISKLNFLQKW